MFDDRTRAADAPGLGDRVTGAVFTQVKRWPGSVDGRRLRQRFMMQWGYSVRRVDYPVSTPGP